MDDLFGAYKDRSSLTMLEYGYHDISGFLNRTHPYVAESDAMSTPAISSFHFDTDGCAIQDRFAMWREVISATHDIAPLEAGSSPFHINFDLWRLDQIAISSGSFSAQSFARPEETIRRDHIDHFALFVQGRGTRYCRVGNDEAVLREYDVNIVDLAQTESSFASAGSSGTLYLPRNLAEEILPNISDFHGKVLRDSMANLLARHILGMGTALPELPAAVLSGLAQATLEMAVACLQSLASASWEMNSAVVFAMRRRVERYIDTRLEDAELSPASVARACDMSRSTLYRFFEPYGGVMAYIKGRRLARIRSILIANLDTRSLAEISQDYGFQSGAHFSREFRREFGCSPSDVRGERPAPLPTSAVPEADSSLSLMFRSLRS